MSTSKILTIAAVLGVIAWIVAYAMLHCAGFTSFMIGLLVAIITAIILWLGWREDDTGQTGSGGTGASTTGGGGVGTAAATGAATTAAATASTSTASTSTLATPASADVASKGASSATKATGAAPKADDALKNSEPGSTDTDASESAATVSAATATEPAASKPTAAKSPAADSAGASKSTTSKSRPVAADGKPEMLDKPRDGQGDDLKQIKGVGPKMEDMLNTMGVWHFDQIASWRKKEVEWVDANLNGFKGRVSRDEWVKQAKVLARGDSTDFAKKVKKGGVY